MELKAAKAKAPPAWDTALAAIVNRINSMEGLLREKPGKATPPTPKRDTLERIGAGMRAITIQTPNESSGVAGLLEPGDRVDLQLTLANKHLLIPSIQSGPLSHAPSETLIENIEVLAVDSNLYRAEGDEGGKMSRSVTLIVFEEMIESIARAHELGKLTLTLRGKADSQDLKPRAVLNIDEFVARHMPAEPKLNDEIVVLPPVTIRTLRGPSVKVLPFEARATRPNKSF
jgi:Flp pilus assembly protein CpaB